MTPYVRIAAAAAVLTISIGTNAHEGDSCLGTSSRSTSTLDQVERCEELEVTDLRMAMLQTGSKHHRATMAAVPQAQVSPAFKMKVESFRAEMVKAEQERRTLESQEAEAKALAKLRGRDDQVAKHGNQDRRVSPYKKAHHAASDSQLVGEVSIVVGAFLSGSLLLIFQQRIAGLLAIYFGAQAGFSLYMKEVLSGAEVSEELGLNGVPAAFLVTAIQQVVAFGILGLGLCLIQLTPWRYTPRRITSFKECMVILLFSAAFAINIGLNNFSLSLLAVSLNLIIRSCLPLVTLILQQIFGTCVPSLGGKLKGVEVSLMVAGVFFAALATLAKSESTHSSTSESKHLVLGVMMCALSDVAAGINLILAGLFGTYLDPPLNPMDTIFYMAVPCAMFLVPASFFVLHPVDWPGVGSITDYEVYQKVMELSPMTMCYVLVSGVLASGYNILQYTVVQQLSPSHAAFAGNFNKAATIMLSICLGLERLPGGIWSTVMVGAILGNIAAFTGYSLLKQSEKAKMPSAEESLDKKLPAAEKAAP